MVLGVVCSDLILHVEPIKAVAIEQVLTLIALQLTIRDNARKYLPQSPQVIFSNDCECRSVYGRKTTACEFVASLLVPLSWMGTFELPS